MIFYKIIIQYKAQKGHTLIHAMYTRETPKIETRNKKAGFQSSVDVKILLHNWI